MSPQLLIKGQLKKLTNPIHCLALSWTFICINKALCPLLSPVYAFISLHHLKHQGISTPPISFSLLAFHLFSSSFMSLLSSASSSLLSFPLTCTLVPTHPSSCFSYIFYVLHLLTLSFLSPPTLRFLTGFTYFSCPLHLPSPPSNHPFLSISLRPFPSSPSSHHLGSPSDDCRAYFIWHEDKGLSTHVVSLQVLCNMKY